MKASYPLLADPKREIRKNIRYEKCCTNSYRSFGKTSQYYLGIYRPIAITPSQVQTEWLMNFKDVASGSFL
jgi:hypothetical protein